MDPGFLEFMDGRPCILAGKHVCHPWLTTHHVRSFGSPKDDTRVLRLCAAGHLHDFGAQSIERLGKYGFETVWGIVIEDEIKRNQEDYAQTYR